LIVVTVTIGVFAIHEQADETIFSAAGYRYAGIVGLAPLFSTSYRYVVVVAVVKEVLVENDVIDEIWVIVVGVVLVAVGAVEVEKVVVVVLVVVVVEAVESAVVVAGFVTVVDTFFTEVCTVYTVLVEIDSHLVQNHVAWRKDNAS
jgi:hypothetical protein